ncbi:MAG: glycosyltransferase involved in cell wall biosynthesis [Bermanella sp.]|jgi:glycosyltransferase involved in cell wall biosynthesis
MDKLKVSLITVSFNSEKTIRDTIESVLSQDYKFIEYIVIDVGSTDSSFDIINDYKGKIQVVVREPDSGIYYAMSKSVMLSSSDVIGVINSNDFYQDSNVISTVVKAFKEDDNSELVLGAIDFVKITDINDSVRGYPSKYLMHWMMRFCIMPPQPAAFIRKIAYDRIGKYKLNYKITSYFYLLLRSLKVDKSHHAKLDRVCVRMRLGGVSTEGLSSFKVISNIILKSLKENDIYSNSLFVLLRVVSKIKQLICT